VLGVVFAFPAAALLLAQAPPSGKPATEQDVLHVGPGVKAPSVTYKVDPQYSPEARDAHIQGTVVCELIVDEHGLPTYISVLSPLGFGLDEMAQAAIERWTFTPGTKDGKPVKIWATIEVNFRFKDERFDTKAEHRRTEFNVAVRHLNRQDPKAAERAVKTIQDLVKQKFPPAMYALGKLESSGEFVQREPADGLALITKAAEKNYGPALYELGAMYYEGNQVPRNGERGLKLLRDAAMLGSSQAQFFLGAHYAAGDGVPRELDRAGRYFRLCAATGVPKCQFELAKLLLDLPGRKERDYVQAIAWALLATDQGLPEARQLADAERPKLTEEQVARAIKLKAQLVHKQP
jgi:TonB family protein